MLISQGCEKFLRSFLENGPKSQNWPKLAEISPFLQAIDPKNLDENFIFSNINKTYLILSEYHFFLFKAFLAILEVILRFFRGHFCLIFCIKVFIFCFKWLYPLVHNFVNNAIHGTVDHSF